MEIYQGYHHPDLPKLVARCWTQDKLLILVPPSLKNMPNRRDLEAHLLEGKQPADKSFAVGLFTSGTESLSPKLVLFTKENFLTSLTDIRSLFEVERIRKIICLPQPTHVFGFALGYLQAMLFNTELVCTEGPYGTKAQARWIESVDSTTLTLGTPTHFHDLISNVRKGQVSCQSSYSAICGGATVTRDLWSQMREVLKIEAPSIGYGATEASPGITHLPPGVCPVSDGDIGFTLPSVKILKNSETGLIFCGPNMATGILTEGKLDLPKKIELKDWITPENNGRYLYHGRVDSVINRGGLKISIEALENHLARKFKNIFVAVSVYDLRLGEDVGLMTDPNGEYGELAVPVNQTDKQEIKNEALEKLHSKILEAVNLELIENFGVKISASNFVLGTIQLTDQGKPNRTECQFMVFRQAFKKNNWQLPMPIKAVQGFMPHRGPAIWLKNILEVKKRFGKAEVEVDPSSHAFSQQTGVLESSCIEWVAQTYGYSRVYCDFLEIEAAPRAKKTFIAEIKNVRFYFNQPIFSGSMLIESECSHDFGPLKVLNGRVFHVETSMDPILIAEMQLKIYAD